MKALLQPNTPENQKELIDGATYLILAPKEMESTDIEILTYSIVVYGSEGEGTNNFNKVQGWLRLPVPSAEYIRLLSEKEHGAELLILEGDLKLEKLQEWPTNIIYPSNVKLTIDPVHKSLLISVKSNIWERFKKGFSKEEIKK